MLLKVSLSKHLTNQLGQVLWLPLVRVVLLFAWRFKRLNRVINHVDFHLFLVGLVAITLLHRSFGLGLFLRLGEARCKSDTLVNYRRYLSSMVLVQFQH